MKMNLTSLLVATSILANVFAGTAIAQTTKDSESESAELSIPASGATAKTMTATSSVIGFGKLVSNLYPASDLPGVNLTSVTIESKDLSKNLSIFKSVKVYLCREDGSGQVLLASKSNISKNAGTNLFFDIAKSSSGGSNQIVASQISADARIEDLIARLPGVIVNGSSVTIRGKSTTGSAGVLFVLNNVTMTSMPIIDASNIKKIEVLKDVSDLAQYGMQGANGVIKIETKSGDRVTPVSTSAKDSNVRVRLEYLLRDGVPSQTDLNVSFMVANKS